MGKSLRKLIVMLLILTVTAAFSGVSAFAYTTLDFNEEADAIPYDAASMHVLGSTLGMLRTLDEGTTAVLSSDMTRVEVTATSSSSKFWGSVTRMALAEFDPEDQSEMEQAASDVVFADSTYSETAAQKVFSFSIPLEDIGRKIPVCVYVGDPDSGNGQWRTFTKQPYFIVQCTKELYDQLTAAEASATDEGVKAALQTAISGMEDKMDMSVPELEKLNKVMMTINSARLYKEFGEYKLDLVIKGTSYTKVYMGYASEANNDDTGAVQITNDGTNSHVTVPVPVLGEPVVYSFLGSKYYNRTLTVTGDRLIYDNTNLSLDQFDGMSLEEALERAQADTSVETVNRLIEAIQVQSRDENTDKYCAIAKAYYEALSDSDKGKLADPDYFGLDTGDASLDDPGNADGIGEKELLVVSFGTSFNDSRVATVKAIEDTLREAFPEYSVRRAFTAQIIINHIQARDGEAIDNMTQALERAKANGVRTLIVQPTHLMHGAEYDEMCGELEKYSSDFDKIIVSEPLLDSDEDKDIVAGAAAEAAARDAGFASASAAAESEDTAFVLMGHGTAHSANAEYTLMQQLYERLGYNNFFVGTVEGEPEDTEVNAVLARVKDGGYTKVVLRPLMIVAGDHANNDMAGDDEDSWKSVFAAELGEANVSCQVNGLGELEAVRNVYVSHVKEAVRPSIEEAEAAPIGNVTYSGSARKPLPVLTYEGKKLVKGEDYELSYASNINAGTASVTVTGINAFTGTRKLTFKILPKEVTPKVTLSKTKVIYNGTDTARPKLTVKVGTLTPKYSTSWTADKTVGKAKVKVTLKGNYKGSKTVSYTVAPKKAVISSAAAGKGKLTLKMKTKVSATGGKYYKVAYRVKGTTSWKYKTFDTRTKTISKLKKGKKYQIKVYAYKKVNGVTYKGAWSKVYTTDKIK